MKNVDNNRLLGNYSEALVAERLSQFCLVRPVPSGTDVGIDLYCESVESNKTFLHFWMQVKSGKQCKKNKDGNSASYPFKPQDLEYWRRQPVPVFCALVPTNWPVSIRPDIFVVDITTQLLSLKQISQNKKRLTSNFHFPANCRDSVEDFVTCGVPKSMSMHSLNHGIITSIPQLEQGYITKTPIVPVENFMDKIIRRLRVTAAQGIRSLVLRDAVTLVNEEERKTLKAILQCFVDDKHWENCFSLALIEHWEKNYPKAIQNYERSRKVIEDDPKIVVENGSEWMKIIRMIKALEDDAKNEKSLRLD